MHKLMSFYYKYQVAISLSLSLRQQSSHLKRYIGRDPSLSALGAEVFVVLRLPNRLFYGATPPHCSGVLNSAAVPMIHSKMTHHAHNDDPPLAFSPKLCILGDFSSVQFTDL